MGKKNKEPMMASVADDEGSNLVKTKSTKKSEENRLRRKTDNTDAFKKGTP